MKIIPKELLKNVFASTKIAIPFTKTWFGHKKCTKPVNMIVRMAVRRIML